MLKKLRKQLENEKGLTLIELLAVIIILAVIAAIAVPAIGNIIKKSEDKALVSEAINYIAGAKLAKIDDVCGETGTACTDTTTGISEYIEGIEGTFSIEYDGTDWEITWSELDNLNDTATYAFNGTGTFTETALKNSIK